MNYKHHPIADIFPMMGESDLRELSADIADNGLRETIWLYEEMVLDGRNRLKACQMAGVEPEFRAYRDSEPLAFVLSKNLLRRHLNESQRAMVGSKIAKLKHGGDRKSDQAANLPVSQSKAAEAMNVGERSVRDAKHVIDQGVPELIEAVESGDVAVSAAAEVAKLPKSEQKSIVKAGPKAVRKAAAEKRKDKKKEKTSPKITIPAIDETLPEVPGVYTPRLTKTSTAKVVIDAYDNPVPSGVADSFMDGRLRAILMQVRSAAEDFHDAYEQLAKLKAKGDSALHYPWLELHTVKTEVEKARNAAVLATDIMKLAMPHGVCPDCSGKTTGCKSCRMSGYWPRQQCEDNAKRFRKGSAPLASEAA